MPRITVTGYKESVPEALLKLDVPIREENKQWRWTKMSIHTEDIKGFEDTEDGETMLILWDENGDEKTLLINEEYDSFDDRLRRLEERYELDFTPEEEPQEEQENE